MNIESDNIESNENNKKTTEYSTALLVKQGDSSLDEEDKMALKNEMNPQKLAIVLTDSQDINNHALTTYDDLNIWKSETDKNLLQLYDKSLYIGIEKNTSILRYYAKLKTSHPEEYETLKKVTKESRICN